MSENTTQLHLKDIFKQLSEIPFHYQNSDDALKSITELGKGVINSHTFILALVNPATSVTENVICSSDNLELENLVNNQKSLWNEIITCKTGKIHSQLERQYNFKTVYSYPLWSVESIIVGYVYHFSTNAESLSRQQQGLIKSFACRAIVTIENFDNYHHLQIHNCLTNLCNLFEALLTDSSEKFISILPEKACEIFDLSICVLWTKAEDKSHFFIRSNSKAVDEEYKKLKLDNNVKVIEDFYHKRGIFYLQDIAKASSHFAHVEEVKKRGWVSMLSAPLNIKGEIVGILDIFTQNARHFTELEKEEFRLFSNYAALCFEKVLKNQETTENIQDREQLEKLIQIMSNMPKANQTDDILKSLLDGSLELITLGNQSIMSTDSLIGELGRLDYLTGNLEIIQGNKPLEEYIPLKLGEGITGKALEEKRTIRIDDVLDYEWNEIYVKCWPNTRSEIAIPIFIEEIPVREGTEVISGSKLIGVLNIESPQLQAFSKTDEKYLSLLARYAAILIDRRESDKKLNQLRKKEQEIAQRQNHNKIMEDVMDSITDILQFEIVNISLVDFENKRIKTEYIKGLSKDKQEEFKKDADHSLDSTDIQAWVVENRKIIVPEDVNDERFDKQIFYKYDHEKYVRVFIPMIEPLGDRVIGTLEAGYKKQYRHYIYERDVQILESFVDYAVHALERKKSGIIDQITHEFRSPIVGIRSNASFIQRRRHELYKDLVDKKLEDILTDCEILLYQVAEFEYLMGGRGSERSKIEKTLIFRDVILKTIYQLRPIVVEHGFSIEDINYGRINPRIKQLRVTTDKIKLNQVVYNLLINSIKYAKHDPNEFKIIIDMSDNNRNLIIKFKDWGIGIDKKYQEEIFKQGFRCPEAIQNNVSGSGLGLAISKSIMRNLRGELILSNNSDPTEFHLIIPKQ